MTELEIAEMCARSGANCGSIFLDLRFRELVKVSSRALLSRTITDYSSITVSFV